MKSLWAAAFAALLALGLVGCSEEKPAASAEPKAEVKPESKDPMAYTGQECLNKMYGLAVRWSRDAVPFHMESHLTSEFNGQDGKAPIWDALFVSQSRGTYKTFTCSGSRLPDSPNFGITSGNDTPAPSDALSLQIASSAIKSDSDKAYKVALEHGGAALLKKDAKQPVSYTLDFNHKMNAPLWFVYFGPSKSDNKGAGAINATTGAFAFAAK